MNKIKLEYEDFTLYISIIGNWQTFVQSSKNIIKCQGYFWNPEKKIWFKKFNSNLLEIKNLLKVEYDFLKQNFDKEYLDYSVFKQNLFDLKNKIENLGNDNIQNIENLPKNILTKLMPHQKEGIKRFNNQNNNLLLGWMMGCGKTFGSLAIVKSINKKAIIISPKSLLIQWKEEILKWNITTEDKIYIFDDNYKFLPNNCDFYILNYEKLRFLSKDKNNQLTNTEVLKFKKLKNKQDDTMTYEDLKVYNELYAKNMQTYAKKEKILNNWILNLKHYEFILIWDELYKIKNYKSKLHIAHKKLKDKFKWSGIVGLTGTPMENNIFEFYTIVNFISPFCITWQQMEKYFIYRPNKWTIKFRNLQYFNKLASKIMHRVTMEDVRDDLPELTQTFRFIKNNKNAHGVASILKNNTENGIFEIYTTLKTLDSYFKPKESLKMYTYVKDYLVEHTAKYMELLNILTEINEKQILIFTQYSTTSNWLKNGLKKEGYKIEEVTGQTKSDEKERIKKKFKNGETQIVVATDTWSRGVDLPNINYLCNWDLPFNPSLYAQRIKRIYRINSNDHKVIINLVSDIIEKDVYNIIKEKLKNVEQAVEGVSEKEIMQVLAKKWGIKSKKINGE